MVFHRKIFHAGLNLCIIFFLVNTSLSEVEKKSKIVSTLLNAKWSNTPLVLEVAECLAEENNEYFWDFLDYLSDKTSIDLEKLTQQEIYENVISFASRYLSWTKLKLLRFSLSLRTQSPKVEMFQQVALERGVDDLGCDAVVDFRGKLSCELPADIASTGSEATSGENFVLSVDHVHPHSVREEELIVLYADGKSGNFAELHHKILELVKRGRVTYVFRPYLHSRPQQKVRLSGYGVELQIKSTEYKAQDDRQLEADKESGDDYAEEKNIEKDIEGFYFNTLNQLNPDDKEKLAEFRQFLMDKSNDMAPLKVWQLQDLSLQAASRIMNSPAENRLNVLADLSQNFPSYGRTLSRASVSKELKREVSKNRDVFMHGLSVQPSDAALFINGMYFDMDYVDIFTLMDTIKSEANVLDGLGRLGLSDEQARKFVALDFSGSKQNYGIDIRDSAVNWINNIEKDKIYSGWPASVNELLRPTFPGMLRSIRKNFFNIVIVCDPASKAARPLLKMLESFYVHRAPTRIGIVFAVNTKRSGEEDAGVAFLNAFNYISMTKEDPYEALSFITDVYNKVGDDGEIDASVVHKHFLENFGADIKLKDVFDEDSQYDIGRQLADDFLERSGFKETPQVLMNGIPIDQKSLTAEDFEEAIMMGLMRETNSLQKAVYKNLLKDKDDTVDYLMSQPNIMPRLNERILNRDSVVSFDLNGDAIKKLSVETFAPLPKASMAATFAEHAKYLTKSDDKSKLHFLTAWVVADLETSAGREILRGALPHVKSSGQMRLAVVHNTQKPGLISKAYQAAVETQTASAARNLIGKLVKEDTVKALLSGKKSLTDYDIPGFSMEAFSKSLQDMQDDVFEIHRIFAQSLPNFEVGQNGLVLNGRVVGPLNKNEKFGTDDFNLLEKFSMNMFGDKMVNAYYSYMDTKDPKGSDVAMKIAAMLVPRPESKSRSQITAYGEKESVIVVEPQFPDKPSFDITAIVDPASQGAQKISSLLIVLKEVLNAKIRVFLNCVDKHSEMPLKSYYRVVLEPEPSFSATGELLPGPQARFSNLPEQPIFTMHIHIPDNWLIEPVKSVYDLDNIKLESIEGNVYSEFELEYLLLEGHCFEAYTGNPPRGLQLTLGTRKTPVFVDTIVMANLGYLQLKSNPGRWLLSLREGRSSELYDITTHEGTEKEISPMEIQVLIHSFKSKIVKLKVTKKPDKKNEDLLEADSGRGDDEGLLGSILSTFGGSSHSPSTQENAGDDVINIFCLASGHLYERLLKIMMLSVIRTTKSPVKFWILKNYLSPAIKDFLPQYSKQYGFEYEYVQYKWPRWLNQQKDKQRIIWGYKILFLDVMFPLDVKKIIFVDTDQIVRADLKELRDLDLGGAPYGYTPFCDSNKDMEGFRFWKSGYWRNHLAGKPYHISALYVVDLVRFRQLAAGDRLRGQYQALSQDPNSLANLDQDLPNNMIHQVPIKSLPQEWLWCETWCDQTSKKYAKSIDLCNNPLTKESKLTAARRIVAEWTDYDEEMNRLAENIKSGKATTKPLPDQAEKHTEL